VTTRGLIALHSSQGGALFCSRSVGAAPRQLTGDAEAVCQALTLRLRVLEL